VYCSLWLRSVDYTKWCLHAVFGGAGVPSDAFVPRAPEVKLLRTRRSRSTHFGHNWGSWSPGSPKMTCVSEINRRPCKRDYFFYGSVVPRSTDFHRGYGILSECTHTWMMRSYSPPTGVLFTDGNLRSSVLGTHPQRCGRVCRVWRSSLSSRRRHRCSAHPLWL